MHDGMFGDEGAGLTAVVAGEYTPIAWQCEIPAWQHCAGCDAECMAEMEDGQPLYTRSDFKLVPASTRTCVACGMPLFDHDDALAVTHA